VLQAESTTSEPLQIPILPIATRYTPAAVFRARVEIRIGAPLFSKDFQQENEKQTAQALTQGLQVAMLEELAELGVTPELYQRA
jgi:1-acyl-sn-glycerol-3-phosphate acyltransferase